MTAVPFAIAMTAVQPAASVSRVGTTSGGLEISGSVAVQTEEGLSFGGVRKGTERAAFPAVAGMPDTRYKESSGTAREISPSALARFSPCRYVRRNLTQQSPKRTRRPSTIPECGTRSALARLSSAADRPLAICPSQGSSSGRPSLPANLAAHSVVDSGPPASRRISSTARHLFTFDSNALISRRLTCPSFRARPRRRWGASGSSGT
jgi:hypothetical protein